MKKIYLLMAVIAAAFNYSNAQGWAKSITPGAATNVYHNFTFDNNNNPVVIGGAAEISGGGQPLVFMKFDKQTGMRSLLKRYNGRTNAKSYKLHTDAQGNTYFFGTFMDYIAFGNDTVYTYDKMYWNNANFILIKFDSEGNRIWSKKFGQKFGSADLGQVLDAQFTETGFHAMLSYGSDSVFYENAFVEKLAYAGTNMSNFCLLKIDLADGSLSKFKKIGGWYSSYAVMFTVKPDGSYDFGTMEYSGTKKFVMYSFKDDNNPVVVKCSTNIIDRTNGSGNDFEGGVWHNGYYYMLALNQMTAEGWSTYDGDSVKILPSPYNLRAAMIIKFDSTMKLKDYVRFQWRNNSPKLYLSKGKIVTSVRFSNTMYIENDSMVNRNNQLSMAVLAFNEDLSIADSLQINTVNSSGGSFEINCAGYDNAGNLYGQVYHNKNIDYYGTVVVAAQKSWDNLTVLFRKGDNVSTGSNENKLPLNVVIYPNPSDKFITIDADVEQVCVYDITGKELIRSNSKQVDVSDLKQGVYFIRAINQTQQFHARFIRN